MLKTGLLTGLIVRYRLFVNKCQKLADPLCIVTEQAYNAIVVMSKPDIRSIVVDICKQLESLLKLLNSEVAQANQQGFNTITLTDEEVAKITNALSEANKQISHVPQMH